MKMALEKLLGKIVRIHNVKYGWGVGELKRCAIDASKFVIVDGFDMSRMIYVFSDDDCEKVENEEITLKVAI